MRISAIIPAYNAARPLPRAVASLVATRYPDLEIVVVDDGSRDTTFEVAHELRDRYPGIVSVCHHPRRVNRGVSASRNLGIRTSTGEVICFLDADDYVYPHRFDAASPLLAVDDTIDGVYENAKVEFMDPGASRRWQGGAVFGLSDDVPPEQLLRRLLTGHTWHTSAILCRRSLLERTGLFHEQLRIAEDCHLWFRMAAVGRLVPGDRTRPVSAYCRHDANTFEHGLERKRDMVLAMADACCWAGQRRLGEGVKQAFKEGLAAYVLRGMVAAREAGRPRLACRLVWTALSRAFVCRVLTAQILKQIAHASKESLAL